jgi:hypothetical protein
VASEATWWLASSPHLLLAERPVVQNKSGPLERGLPRASIGVAVAMRCAIAPLSTTSCPCQANGSRLVRRQGWLPCAGAHKYRPWPERRGPAHSCLCPVFQAGCGSSLPSATPQQKWHVTCIAQKACLWRQADHGIIEVAAPSARDGGYRATALGNMIPTITRQRRLKLLDSFRRFFLIFCRQPPAATLSEVRDERHCHPSHA